VHFLHKGNALFFKQVESPWRVDQQKLSRKKFESDRNRPNHHSVCEKSTVFYIFEIVLNQFKMEEVHNEKFIYQNMLTEISVRERVTSFESPYQPLENPLGQIFKKSLIKSTNPLVGFSFDYWVYVKIIDNHNGSVISCSPLTNANGELLGFKAIADAVLESLKILGVTEAEIQKLNVKESLVA
jgi:hypothetical protein